MTIPAYGCQNQTSQLNGARIEAEIQYEDLDKERLYLNFKVLFQWSLARWDPGR